MHALLKKPENESFAYLLNGQRYFKNSNSSELTVPRGRSCRSFAKIGKLFIFVVKGIYNNSSYWSVTLMITIYVSSYNLLVILTSSPHLTYSQSLHPTPSVNLLWKKALRSVFLSTNSIAIYHKPTLHHRREIIYMCNAMQCIS